jgi:hypothetical protein
MERAIDGMLTRQDLAKRWRVSVETLKRRERIKLLRPVRLEGRVVRYKLSDVLRIENDAMGGGYEE